jgi:hypothetical protein
MQISGLDDQDRNLPISPGDCGAFEADSGVLDVEKRSALFIGRKVN